MYIEREVAIERLEKLFQLQAQTARAIVEVIPAADVRKVVRRKWIWDDEGYHCSECFYHAYGETGEVLSGH